MSDSVLLKSDLPGFQCQRGKVRDVYDLGEQLLVVTTDRISAFDVVLPNGIPDKGKVLTRLSAFWFKLLGVSNHLLTTDVSEMPASLQPFRDQLEGRTMLVEKLDMLPVECIARGYITGSGWADYKKNQSVCGIPLPAGLQESERLPDPIFTPSTKAETGHDENISFDEVAKLVGAERASELGEQTINVFKKGTDYALTRGLIIADTKFEWGLRKGGDTIVLGDEVLTPDSSRFWPADDYAPGRSQPSFDKQYVRDYLKEQDWDRTPPGPELPEEIVQETSRRYRELYERMTGEAW
ncbi:MAG: phosphoribosylaminoimidazolesuccinocarboxamide synthase [Planctomycetes bacterium]|nr:phosphoribosylaminoimidazolesuccinocarboxamide synthase [Planctomycetota bacterium]